MEELLANKIIIDKILELYVSLNNLELYVHSLVIGNLKCKNTLFFISQTRSLEKPH